MTPRLLPLSLLLLSLICYLNPVLSRARPLAPNKPLFQWIPSLISYKSKSTLSPATLTPSITVPDLLAPMQSFAKTIADNKRHLLAGAVARLISISVFFPIDSIKTRLQVGLPINPVSTLYAGLPVSLVGQLPYSVLTFGGYAVYKEVLGKAIPSMKDSLGLFVASAVLGDLTGSIWLCPSEVIKQNLQASLYDNPTSAVLGVIQKNGVFGGLYKGYLGNVARDVPFRVLQMVSYEIVKEKALRDKARRGGLKNAPKSLTLANFETAIVGAVAGTFSAALTTPLDKVKTLLMTGKFSGSYLACVNHVVKNEGVSGLFSGIVPRVALIGPSVAVFFVVYEEVAHRVATWEEVQKKVVVLGGKKGMRRKKQ